MTLTRPWPLPPDSMTTLHLVTDTHVGYQPWSEVEHQHVLTDLEKGLIPPVDALVHAGDITDHALAAEDTYALSWLGAAAKGAPSLWVPGNHDLFNTRTTTAAWEAVYGRSANSYLDVGGYRLVGFAPSSWAEHTDWTISAATWTWLDMVCGSTNDQVILVEHYPPWELGVPDEHALKPAASLADLVSAHSHIEGMLAGHMHYKMGDQRSASFITLGNRPYFPVVMGISMSFAYGGRSQSGAYAAVSAYISLLPGERWEVRYRLHGPRAWGGHEGTTVTTLDLVSGSVTRGIMD